MKTDLSRREKVALAILNGMISSPPEGVDRFSVDKALWCSIAFKWADAFLKEASK